MSLGMSSRVNEQTGQSGGKISRNPGISALLLADRDVVVPAHVVAQLLAQQREVEPDVLVGPPVRRRRDLPSRH